MVTTSETQPSSTAIGETLWGLKPLGDLQFPGGVCINEPIGDLQILNVCVATTLGDLQTLGEICIGERLGDLVPLGDICIGEAVEGLECRGDDNGDIPTWASRFLTGELFVGVVCLGGISAVDLSAPQFFFAVFLLCFFPLPRSARRFSLERNSFASSFNSLRDLDGEEPVTLTSSSSVTERVDEDLVEMRPLTRGVSGMIVMSVLGGETSRTCKEKAWRCKTNELRKHPRRKDPPVGKSAARFPTLSTGWIEQPLPSAGKHVTGVKRGENVKHVFPCLAQVGSSNPFQARENM